MEFSPSHPVIKFVMKGMHLNETGNAEEAAKTFLQAWNEAADDFEIVHLSLVHGQPANRYSR